MLNFPKSLLNKNFPKFFSTSKPAHLNHIYIPAKKPARDPYNLIVVHGLFGSAANFRGIMKDPKISLFANSYLLDMRNHGSSEHKDSMTLKEMADDIYAFIQENNIKSKVVILGHSMGARVTLTFCLHYPQILSGVIIEDMIPYDYNNDPRFPIYKKTKALLEKLVKIDLNRGYQSVVEEIRAVSGSKMVADFVMTNVKKNEATGNYQWKCNLPVLLESYSNVEDKFEVSSQERFTGPLKVIFGDKSEYYSKDLLPNFKNVFPHFDEQKHVSVVKNAAHWVHFDQPEAFIEEIHQFLRTLEA